MKTPPKCIQYQAVAINDKIKLAQIVANRVKNLILGV